MSYLAVNSLYSIGLVRKLLATLQKHSHLTKFTSRIRTHQTNWYYVQVHIMIRRLAQLYGKQYVWSANACENATVTDRVCVCERIAI